MTRWPVMSASLPASFSTVGRGLRTGHWCMSDSLVDLLPWPTARSVATSSTVCIKSISSLPSEAFSNVRTTVPRTLGGTMMEWSATTSFSYTTPSTSPPVTTSPARKLAAGLNRQVLARSSELQAMPRSMYTLSSEISLIVASGR